MGIVSFVLLIVAIVLFLGAAHPKVTASWALGWIGMAAFAASFFNWPW